MRTFEQQDPRLWQVWQAERDDLEAESESVRPASRAIRRHGIGTGDDQCSSRSVVPTSADGIDPASDSGNGCTYDPPSFSAADPLVIFARGSLHLVVR